MLPALLALVLLSGGGGTSTTSSSHTSSTSTHSSSSSSGGSKSDTSGTGSGSKSGSSSTGGGNASATGSGSDQVEPTGGGSTATQGPVAYFVASSPVAPGMQVVYTDESYDTDPGAQIVQSTWDGRASSFAVAGAYTVSLTVTDSDGRTSTYTTHVLVSGTSAQPPAGQPAAFFLVTSPVEAGTPVTFTDESYDLDANARIVDEQWSGRELSYATPGTYPVTLRVEDSTGAWSSPFTRDVVVVAPPATPPAPAPTSQPPVVVATWTAEASPDPATPGTLVTVTAIASFTVDEAPTLIVPAPLQGTWGGTSYAAANASGPMTQTGATVFTRTIEVPDSVLFPAATYDLTVDPPSGAQPITVALVVQAATSYIEPIVSGA